MLGHHAISEFPISTIAAGAAAPAVFPYPGLPTSRYWSQTTWVPQQRILLHPDVLAVVQSFPFPGIALQWQFNGVTQWADRRQQLLSVALFPTPPVFPPELFARPRQWSYRADMHVYWTQAYVLGGYTATTGGGGGGGGGAFPIELTGGSQLFVLP